MLRLDDEVQREQLLLNRSGLQVLVQHLRCCECRNEGNVCGGVSPAESLWDELQVVVRSHELCEAGEFANAGRNPVEVQLVRVDVQLLQFRQLTDCRLDGGKM